MGPLRLHPPATASSGLPVTFSSNGSPGVCNASFGSTVTIVGAGTCSLTALQTGDAIYAPAYPVTQSFIVSGAPQTITFAPSVDQYLGSIAPVTLSASSGLGVSVSVNTPSVCGYDASDFAAPSLITFAPGTCSVTVTQSGSPQWAATSSTVNLNVKVTISSGPSWGLTAFLPNLNPGRLYEQVLRFILFRRFACRRFYLRIRRRRTRDDRSHSSPEARCC